MARIEALQDEKASLLSRVIFGAVRRRLGLVSEMWRVCAHVPRLQFGRAIAEVMLDRSALVERRLRWLGVIKTAVMIGCPA